MEIFVNECSLHGQFHDIIEFEKAIRDFFTILTRLKATIDAKSLWWDSQIYLCRAVNEQPFSASLKTLPDKSLRQALIDTLNNKLNVQDWRAKQVHSSDNIYLYQDEIVTDTSIAELAERLLCDPNLVGLLINFLQSKFAGNVSIDVLKHDSETISVDCVETRIQLETWLEAKLKLSQSQYDYTSKIPPTDSQTVLVKTNRFIVSTLPPEHGRKVYKEIFTGYYWYVDNYHIGYGAEIEVFNAQGDHLGVANLDGVIDFSKRKKSRTIQI